jgi:hypothetical protein
MKTKKIATLFLILNLFVLTQIVSSNLNVVDVDSVITNNIIKAGKTKLNALIDLNNQYLSDNHPEKLNFVVTLNPEDYLNDVAIPNKGSFLSSTSLENNYNTRLNQIYQNDNLECYLILINFFDVKLTATIPDSYELNEVFGSNGFFAENSNIADLKVLHENISLGILYEPTSSTRKRYVISMANYCSAEFNATTGGTGCFTLYAPYKVTTATSSPIAYFDETFNYFKGYLKADESFLKEPLRDLKVDKLITDFEKAVKNYKKKALILQTNTTSELKTILSFFSNQDYQLLSNAERTHILKVFSGGLIWQTTETEILSILNTTPKDSVNTILNNLITVNVNSKRLLKHLFDGFQQGNYKNLVKQLCNMVGNSTLFQYNLPDVEAEIQANQISPSWSRVFEWSDCSNTTMFMEENNTDECKRPSHWQHAEKRYFTITMNSMGAIEINGKIKKVEAVISNSGAYNVTLENITPSTLNPYDLIVFVDKSTIEGLNDITETSGGTMVVPALFLVYAKDKAFNSEAFDAAMTLTSIVGVEEILASKLLSKLSGFKRLLKVFRKTGVVANAGDILVQRVSFWDDWIAKCFPNKISSNTTFKTKGKDYNLFKNTNSFLDNEMRSMYNTTSDADTYLPAVIESGSNVPTKITASSGEKFYKIVPNGGNINSPSPYYLSQAEYNWIKANPSQLEQKLGLPLGSVSGKYDVFTITSKVNNDIFQSSIAATEQYAKATPNIVYRTTGGRTQSLIINNGDQSKWIKSSTPIETISPNVLPQIGN